MRRLLAALVVAACLLTIAPLTSAPVPKSIKGPGTIFLWRNGSPTVITLLTPEGDFVKEIELGKKEPCRVLSISPGGRYAAVERHGRRLNRWDFCWHVHLVDLTRLEGTLPEPIAEGWNPHVCWSTDGRTAYVSTDAEDPESLPPRRQPRATVLTYDIKTGVGEEWNLSRRHRVLDVVEGGRTFLSSEAIRDEREGWVYSRWVVRGLEETQLSISQEVYPIALHPDGKRVFASRYSENRELEAIVFDPVSNKVTVLGWTGKMKDLIGQPPSGWALSPDTKRVAVMWHREIQKPADWNQEGPCLVPCLGVCDLDGTNFKTISSPEPKTLDEVRKTYVRGFAWR